MYLTYVSGQFRLPLSKRYTKAVAMLELSLSEVVTRILSWGVARHDLVVILNGRGIAGPGITEQTLRDWEAGQTGGFDVRRHYRAIRYTYEVLEALVDRHGQARGSRIFKELKGSLSGLTPAQVIQARMFDEAEVIIGMVQSGTGQYGSTWGSNST